MGILLNISRAAPEPAPGVKGAGWPKLALFAKRGNRKKPGGGRRVTVEVPTSS